MTKTFEKDLNEKLNSEKVPMYITQKGCSLTRKTFIETNWIFDNYKNWHSDEEFQELLDKYSHLNDNYEKEVITSSKLESQIIDLKSQLQQQALPVVPECVAEWYEGCAPIPVETCITDFLFNYQKEKSVDDGTEFEQWFIRTDNSIEILMDMKRLGYTVKKPQLFYLKHIDMSKRDSDSDWYLIKDDEGLDHEWEFRGEMPEEDRFKFTQSEIDSMQTGSYEQIPVPVEDGE